MSAGERDKSCYINSLLLRWIVLQEKRMKAFIKQLLRSKLSNLLVFYSPSVDSHPGTKNRLSFHTSNLDTRGEA